MQRLAIAALVLIGFQVSAFDARAGTAETLEAECHKQLNLGNSACACIGERAEATLNEKQQGLVVAMVTKDQAASTALQQQMTVGEMTGAANFMAEAPGFCANQ